jgi:hypothetical protein
MLDMSWETRIMRQLDIPHYQDPWDSSRQVARCYDFKKNYKKTYWIKNIKTNEIKKLRSQREAADYMGVCKSGIGRYIEWGSLVKKTFLVAENSDFFPKPKPYVLVTDNQTGEIIKCHSLQEYWVEKKITKGVFSGRRTIGRYSVKWVKP